MKIPFTKMHGCGNDYVYVDMTKKTNAVPPELDREAFAIRISDRHFGIGSDGLILICDSDVADFRMEMYNADGSLGKMCGNGIRCVAKYVYDHGLTDKTTITVETGSGIKTLELTVEDGKVAGVRVNMGAPDFTAANIPVVCTEEEAVKMPLSVGEKEYEITAVSMGNPHCVVFLDEHPKDFPVETIGPLFENHERFPDRINTEFIQVVDEHEMNMRVWERGSGETLACGTGACASACAGIRNNMVKSPVTIHLTGGDLMIEWDGTGDVFMTGPATEVYEGEINGQDQ